jgi:alpha-mannosidase
MTSPQVYEEVVNPFTSLSFFDLQTPDLGVLVIHDGSQAHFRNERGIQVILTMNDPWDEDYFVRKLDARFRILPHRKMATGQLWEEAQAFRRPPISFSCREERGRAEGEEPIPPTLELVRIQTPGVAVTALYRETQETGNGLADYAASRIEYPIILRLLELDGRDTEVRLKIAGTVASCARTNLMGERIESECEVRSQQSVEVDDAVNGVCSEIVTRLRANEIATLYLEVVEARKVSRYLDNYRNVWSRAHRVEPTDGE